MESTERMQMVSSLATAAKADPSVIPDLWRMVERLIGRICLRYCSPEAGTRLYEFDDLYHSAYFGFLDAIKKYDSSRGAFSTFLVYHVRRSCRREIGYYGKKRDPIFDAGSIDAPLAAGQEENTLTSTLEDPTAEEPFIQVEQHMVVAAILEEVSRLPDKARRQIIKKHTYRGVPMQLVANSLGISKQWAYDLEQMTINYLRRQPKLWAMYNEYQAENRKAVRDSAVSPYRKKSTASFHSDFTSVVEAIVARLESDHM